MNEQSGFVLVVTSIILGVSALLLIGILDNFVLEQKLSEIHYKKIQNFYSAESRILALRRSIELGEENKSAKLIKMDRCENRYYQIQVEKPELKVEYLLFNQFPPLGCKKSSQKYRRLWWLG